MSDLKSAFSAENYDRNMINTIPYYDEVYDQIADVVLVKWQKQHWNNAMWKR